MAPGSCGFVADSDGLAAAAAPLVVVDLAEGWTFSLSVMVWCGVVWCG